MTTLFQYCQKMVVFSPDMSKVLLAQRKGESDYDEVFSFVGGKMETTDEGILEGLRREKTEEIGSECRIRLFPDWNTQAFFRKKDGNAMILPHYFAIFLDGDIRLNNEYGKYVWVSLEELGGFEPKIPTIEPIVKRIYENRAFVMRGREVIL